MEGGVSGDGDLVGDMVHLQAVAGVRGVLVEVAVDGQVVCIGNQRVAIENGQLG